MLFNLIMVFVINGQSFDYVIDSDLPRDVCLDRMIVIGDEFQNGVFKCEQISK